MWLVLTVVISTLLLFAGVIALFTKLLKHLESFVDALRSHAKLNKELNDELAKAVEQRRSLQSQYDTIEGEYRRLKNDNSRLTNRVSQLEQDKTTNNEIVQALTAQLALVKADLEKEREQRQALENSIAHERQERERIIGEMRSKIEQLSEANAQLVMENQRLRKQVDELCDRAKQANGAKAQPEKTEQPVQSQEPAEKKEN